MTNWHQRLPIPANSNGTKANGLLLHAVVYDFLDLKKKIHLRELDLPGEHKGSVTSCHSLVCLRNPLHVASEGAVCLKGVCVAVLTD